MSNLMLLNTNTLYNKAERMAAALFLVSNGMAESEILRTKIRSLSLDLVSLCVSIKDNTEADSHRLFRVLEKKVLELISLLSITSISGLISEMNACVLKKEFEIFLKFVSELVQSVETLRPVISKEFFENANDAEESIKDNIWNGITGHENSVPKFFLRDKIQDKAGRKNQRNKDILALISKRRIASIKDIASFIKGCSEKTVQRELSLLIAKGLIKKVGERRWSRYSLV